MIELLALAALGLAIHVLGNLAEDSAARGHTVNPVTHIKGKPWRYSLAALTTVVSFMLVWDSLLAQMAAGFTMEAKMAALGLGYGNSSLMNKAASTAQKAIDKGVSNGHG